jgi:hypothetical protein
MSIITSLPKTTSGTRLPPGQLTEEHFTAPLRSSDHSHTCRLKIGDRHPVRRLQHRSSHSSCTTASSPLLGVALRGISPGGHKASITTVDKQSLVQQYRRIEDPQFTHARHLGRLHYDAKYNRKYSVFSKENRNAWFSKFQCGVAQLSASRSRNTLKSPLDSASERWL